MAMKGMRTPELIKIGAIGGIGASGVGGHLRAEPFRVFDAGVCGADEIVGAFGTAAGLFAGRRVAQVFALTGVDAVRIEGAVLRG